MLFIIEGEGIFPFQRSFLCTNFSLSPEENPSSEDTVSSECSLWLFLCKGQYSQLPGLVPWDRSRRNMSLWVRRFRWACFFPARYLNLGRTEPINNGPSAGTVRVVESDFYLLWMYWLCRYTGLLLSKPYWGSEGSGLCFTSYDIHKKLRRAAVCWEYKFFLKSGQPEYHVHDQVKQTEYRQNSVSYRKLGQNY